MELGATVCTVHQAPDCAGCPINGQCQAYAAVEEHRLSGGDPSAAPSVTAYPEKVACLLPLCSCCPESSLLTGKACLMVSHDEAHPAILCGPAQVEKAKRSEQSVAVCVLEMHGPGDSKKPSRQYLLVQRPKEGLLAGEA